MRTNRGVWRPNMVDEVWPGIFRMEVPLPGSPLKAMNSYLILGADRSLLIDTGMRRRECFEAIEAGLSGLGVPMERVDFFITHFHPDHIGLVPQLVREGAQVYLSRLDAAVIRDPDEWTRLAGEALLNGLAEDDVRDIMAEFPGRERPSVSALGFAFLRDGDHLSCGPYVLRCIETPGHTPGHLCLYEERARILFSGDHVLGGITPFVSGWLYEGDALGEYLDSLDKVNDYKTDWVFPGHRAPFRALGRRISQIKRHHEARTDEVLAILANGRQTALEVASCMTWGIRSSSWETTPSLQKWFAGGEALAHLEYLRGRGRVGREVREGRALFRLA